MTRYECGGRSDCITVDEDQGRYVVMVALAELKSLEWWGLRGDLEHRSYRDESILGAKSDFNVDQTGSGRMWSDRVSWLLRHVVSSYECQSLTTTQR